jgi:hypothetical protein
VRPLRCYGRGSGSRGQGHGAYHGGPSRVPLACKAGSGEGVHSVPGAGISSGLPGAPIEAEQMAIRFGLSTWNKDSNTYVNPPLEFIRPEPGYTHLYGRLPSLLGLLDKL